MKNTAAKRQEKADRTMKVLNHGAWNVVTIGDTGNDTADGIVPRFHRGDLLTVCVGFFRKKDVTVIDTYIGKIGGKYFEIYHTEDEEGNEYCTTLNAVEDTFFRRPAALPHFYGLGYTPVYAF